MPRATAGHKPGRDRVAAGRACRRVPMQRVRALHVSSRGRLRLRVVHDSPSAGAAVVRGAV